MFYLKFITDEICKIKINDFEEEFEITLDYWPKEKYKNQWNKEIQKLIKREKDIVALMSWMHKPGSKDNYRAWIFYRENDKIFIQDQLFLANQSLPNFDENEYLLNIPKRVESNEEGEEISQWEINVKDISSFIDNK